MSNRPYYHVNAIGRAAIEADPERFGSLNDAEAAYNVAKLSGKATQLRDEWFSPEAATDAAEVVKALAGIADVKIRDADRCCIPDYAPDSREYDDDTSPGSAWDEDCDRLLSEVRAALPAGWAADWSDDDIIIDRE